MAVPRLRRLARDEALVTCPSGKISFPSPQAAMAKTPRKNGRVKAYKCPHCAWWHLTKAGAKRPAASR